MLNDRKTIAKHFGRMVGENEDVRLSRTRVVSVHGGASSNCVDEFLFERDQIVKTR